MSTANRNQPHDPQLKQLHGSLSKYGADHPSALTEAYRRNAISIRVRIIDPDFQGQDRVERETNIWKLLGDLPDVVKAEITLLVLLTPDEADTSFASFEFDNPSRSRL
jgi:hypothetical protein